MLLTPSWQKAGVLYYSNLLQLPMVCSFIVQIWCIFPGVVHGCYDHSANKEHKTAVFPSHPASTSSLCLLELILAFDTKDHFLILKILYTVRFQESLLFWIYSSPSVLRILSHCLLHPKILTSFPALFSDVSTLPYCSHLPPMTSLIIHLLWLTDLCFLISLHSAPHLHSKLLSVDLFLDGSHRVLHASASLRLSL